MFQLVEACDRRVASRGPDLPGSRSATFSRFDRFRESSVQHPSVSFASPAGPTALPQLFGWVDGPRSNWFDAGAVMASGAGPASQPSEALSMMVSSMVAMVQAGKGQWAGQPLVCILDSVAVSFGLQTQKLLKPGHRVFVGQVNPFDVAPTPDLSHSLAALAPSLAAGNGPSVLLSVGLPQRATAHAIESSLERLAIPAEDLVAGESFSNGRRACVWAPACASGLPVGWHVCWLGQIGCWGRCPSSSLTRPWPPGKLGSGWGPRPPRFSGPARGRGGRSSSSGQMKPPCRPRSP